MCAFAEKGLRAKVGSPAYLQNWITTITPLTAAEATFDVTFAWEQDFGLPGAFTIRNLHRSEFYLKTLILEDVPGHGHIYFICNSWVYPAKRYSSDRVFFANKVLARILTFIFFFFSLFSKYVLHIFKK